MKTKLIIAAFATVKTTSKNTAVACLVLLISVGSIKGQWTPGTGNAIDTYWSPTTNSVAIGINQPAYKLHVVDDNSAATNNVSAGYFDYTSLTNPSITYYGIRANCTDASGNTNTSVGVEATAQDGGITNTGDAIGFQGNATISGSGDSYGGNFTATGGNIAHGLKAAANTGGLHSYGVFGSVNGPSTLASSINSGVVGEGSGTGAGIINAGVLGKLNATGAAKNAAIYGDANGYSGGTDWAGYFVGNVRVVGSGLINTAWTTSDQRFKKDINHLENVSEKIQKLSGYSYKFRTDEFKEKNFDDRTHIGFIAQELKEVFPELVSGDEKDYYAVDYQGMIPILLEALKELQNQITILQQNKQSAPTAIDKLNIAQSSAYAMETNIPNPFSHETTIAYTLPQEVSNAYIAVYDLNGKQIKTISLYERGSSKVVLAANSFAPGMYIYAIVADSEVIDTKRMIVADKE